MEPILRRPGGLEKFRATDREECGVVVENDGLLYVLRVPNRAEHNEDYVILKSDVDKVKAVLAPDEKIIGFFHTHLPHHPCDPSDRDFDGAQLNPEMQNVIYKPDTDEICWYGGLTEVLGDKT